jgi:hypothetical protein
VKQEQESAQRSNCMFRKGLCLLNPAYFIENVLGYDCKPHHNNILTNISNNMISLDLAPRGFGKSSIGNIAYCILRIVQDRNIRILIVSNKGTATIST